MTHSKEKGNTMKKSKILKTLMAMLSVCVLFSCASSKGTKVDSETGEGVKQALFSEYKENRPAATAVKIGNPNADKTFGSIARIYGITTKIFDKYTVSVGNSKTGLQGEEIRQEQGDEAYKKYVASLKGEDKKQYDEYRKNEVKTLDVVIPYLKEATILASAVSKLKPKDLTSNPMKIGSVKKGISLSKKQIEYSCRTLGWLKKTRDSYKAMQTYKGK